MTNDSALSINKRYKGVTDKNCLRWCHGTEGIEHDKVRKFRYPLWKYAQVSHRTISCICRHCSMHFYGAYAENVPLDIPVLRADSYFPYEIPVRVRGKVAALRGKVFHTLGQTTQEMLNDKTRLFIDLVQ